MGPTQTGSLVFDIKMTPEWQVSSIDPDLLGSYTFYTKRFCNAHRTRFGWDVNGQSNVKDLHQLLQKVLVVVMMMMMIMMMMMVILVITPSGSATFTARASAGT
jgi:hypothetical protein